MTVNEQTGEGKDQKKIYPLKANAKLTKAYLNKILNRIRPSPARLRCFQSAT